MTAKRRTKAQRIEAEAKRLADLLLADPNDVTAPPALLADPRLATAKAFWLDHAPKLATLGTLDELSRINLALLAVYVGEFVAAQDDVLAKGYSVLVKTVSGDQMPRENPAVARRDHAVKMILELGRHFGLSRVDRWTMQRLRRNAAGPLFDDDQHRPASAPSAIDGDWLQLTKPKAN